MVDSDFEAWVDSLHLQEPDEGGDIGEVAAGTMQFLREVFDKHRGPAPLEVLRQARNDREMALAHRGVELFSADLHRTTSLTPDIAIWRREDDGTLVVSYNGNYSTPALMSIRAPEALCEVADNLRNHVVDDLWTVWPLCPNDGLGLDPRPVDRQAVWYCRVGNHVLSPIGKLQSSPSDRTAR